MANDIEPITGTTAKVAARLCNIPTGTATLLETHRQWLDKNVKLAIEKLNASWVDLIGYASHRGTNRGFDNLGLSRQRVDAVQKHIATYATNINFAKRQPVGDSQSTGGANDDDGRFRAVDVLVFGSPPPAPTFNTISFDPFTLFLRVGETQEVTVRGGKFLMTVESTAPLTTQVLVQFFAPPPFLRGSPSLGQSVTLATDPQTILVKGVAEGTAVLQAGTNPILNSGPRRILGTMMVTVRSALLKVFFHYLDGPRGIKTTRKPGDEQRLLARVNQIYRLQTGLEFASAGSRVVTIPDLGTRGPGVFVARHKTPDMAKIVARANTGMFMNVFFVGEMLDGELDSTLGQPSDLLAVTDMPSDNETPRRCCIMRDLRSTPREAFIDSGLNLAHETGHALDQPDDMEDPTSLMFFSASADGAIISPEMARSMKESLKKFPP